MWRKICAWWNCDGSSLTSVDSFRNCSTFSPNNNSQTWFLKQWQQSPCGLFGSGEIVYGISRGRRQISSGRRIFFRVYKTWLLFGLQTEIRVYIWTLTLGARFRSLPFPKFSGVLFCFLAFVRVFFLASFFLDLITFFGRSRSLYCCLSSSLLEVF